MNYIIPKQEFEVEDRVVFTSRATTHPGKYLLGVIKHCNIDYLDNIWVYLISSPDMTGYARRTAREIQKITI